MKRALAVLGEFILMLFVALYCMFRRPFHVTHELWRTATQIRSFEADWLIGVLIVAAIIAVVELLLKRIRIAWPQLAIALALMLVVGFSLRLGFTLSDLNVLVY